MNIYDYFITLSYKGQLITLIIIVNQYFDQECNLILIENIKMDKLLPQIEENKYLVHCKLEYLIFGIEWMKMIGTKFDQLILSSKNILRSESNKTSSDQIFILIDKLNDDLKKILVDISNKLMIATNYQIEDKTQFDKQLFLKCKWAMETQIKLIKEDSIRKQLVLQREQQKKVKQIELRKHYNDPSPFLSTVKTYELRRRLLDHYKIKNINLKIQKKILMKKIKYLEQIKQQQKSKDAIKLKSLDEALISYEESPRRPREAMTIFEKTVLIYKKKKTINEKLKQQILRLKNKTSELTQSGNTIQKALQYKYWENLEIQKNQNNVSFQMPVNDLTMYSFLLVGNNMKSNKHSFDFGHSFSRISEYCPQDRMNKNKIDNKLLDVLQIDEQGSTKLQSFKSKPKQMHIESQNCEFIQ